LGDVEETILSVRDLRKNFGDPGKRGEFELRLVIGEGGECVIFSLRDRGDPGGVFKFFFS